MAPTPAHTPENADSGPPGAPDASRDDPEALVRKLAGLARLELAPEEVRDTAPALTRILEAFQTLEQAELPAAPPGTEEPVDELRPDEPRPSLGPDPLLANAPERIEDFYGVPKTIGGAS